MYTHSIHCLSVVHHVPLFVHCYKRKKWFLGVSVSHAHSEALLHVHVHVRATSAVSMVTIEVALVALKSKLEVKMTATKLPSCVTVKTQGQPSVLHVHDV